MPSLDTALIVLAGIALFAAFVNGAIGYGFSSLTVPLALVFGPWCRFDNVRDRVSRENGLYSKPGVF